MSAMLASSSLSEGAPAAWGISSTLLQQHQQQQQQQRQQEEQQRQEEGKERGRRGSADSAAGDDADDSADDDDEYEYEFENGDEVGVIAFEMSLLNTQPAMRSLMLSIIQMHYLFQHQWPTATTATTTTATTAAAPPWLQQILTHMSDSATAHVNERLFLLQLLLNEPVRQIVEPYAQLLLFPVLQLCLECLFSCSGSVSGVGVAAAVVVGENRFHYLLRDVCDAFLGR